MIFGVYCSSPKGSISFLPFTPDDAGNEEINLFPIEAAGFSGGYGLNSRLPYSSSDSCYDSENGMIVLLAGCIYNRKEIEDTFIDAVGVPDPELIARLFAAKGPGFVSGLNGDFVICIVLQQKKQLWLFRDHVGIRPLAWSVINGTLFFSSDLNGLCSCLAPDEVVNSEYLSGHFKYPGLSSTPCSSVSRLMPGHWLRFDDQGVEIKKYWDPEKIKPDRRLTYEAMITGLGELLEDSVRIRCNSRFNAGAHVSGGLDSGVVASLARKGHARQKEFFGFSLSPSSYEADTVEYDERMLVRKLSDMADMTPVFSDMSQGEFRCYVGNYFANLGFFADDAILARAGDLNVNLIFSGWGGDEFISTGSRSIEADLFWGLHFKIFFRRHPVRRPQRLLRVLLQAVLLPALGIPDRDLARSLKQDARYLKGKHKISNREALRNFYMHSSRQSHHLGMLRHYHLQERCEAWSINGWRKGVEYRYPLLDKRIIEYMLRVPSELLCRDSVPRPLLRELAKGLIPEEIRLNRSKVDPVYSEFIGRMFTATGKELAGEKKEWRSNSDLAFIDFDTLEKDISLYQNGTEGVDEKRLFRAVVYIKAFHDFSVRYHRKK